MKSGTLVALMSTLTLACGQSDRERVEDAVRAHEDRAAGRIDEVRCERAAVMWGCSLRLTDGRTQACQVSVDPDGNPTGVGCQPIQAE